MDLGRVARHSLAAGDAPAAAPETVLSHNLLGQRLGRKGRDTRERILATAERMFADPNGGPISLSAVAREAGLSMTTFYLYFADLTEMLLAVLEPSMASWEQTYTNLVVNRWPDQALRQHCIAFVNAFYGFWERHARLLHLRNSHVDNEGRMVRHRIAAAQPLIGLMTMQMDGDPCDEGSLQFAMATALMTGIERTITVSTDLDWPNLAKLDLKSNAPNLLRGQARLLELGIIEGRATRRDGER